MQYKVTKKFGKYPVGAIVDDRDVYIRRKLQEGGCLEKIENKHEEKMLKTKYDNKMVDKQPENKGE